MNCKTIKLKTSPTPIIKQVNGSMMDEDDFDVANSVAS
jgi:hypothetical protein